MSTKHTAGPWHFGGVDGDERNVETGDCAIVCRVWEMGADFSEGNELDGGDRPERDANARLIAAAPDLLAALEAAQAAIDLMEPQLKGPIKPHPFGLVVVDAKQRMRAAIAAAKGEKTS